MIRKILCFIFGHSPETIEVREVWGFQMDVTTYCMVCGKEGRHVYSNGSYKLTWDVEE